MYSSLVFLPCQKKRRSLSVLFRAIHPLAPYMGFPLLPAAPQILFFIHEVTPISQPDSILDQCSKKRSLHFLVMHTLIPLLDILFYVSTERTDSQWSPWQ